jgi:hypothetical protein
LAEKDYTSKRLSPAKTRVLFNLKRSISLSVASRSAQRSTIKAETKIINLLLIGGELKFAIDYANCVTPLLGAGAFPAQHLRPAEALTATRQ